MDKPVAIVLGAAVWPGGVPSPTLWRRAERAAALYRDGAVRGIVTTGGVGTHPPSEARVVREAITSLGVPPDAVREEDQSHTTFENLKNAKALLGADTDVIIVSDWWHLPRARLAARRLGLNATGAAASLKGSRPTGVLRAALRELAALAWYLIRPMK